MDATVDLSIWEVAGPVAVMVSAGSGIAILALIGLGLRSRRTGAPTVWAWWLRMGSRLLLIFGLLWFSGFLTKAFLKIGIGAVGDPEKLMMDLGQAFARLTLPLSVALLAHVGAMVVGRPGGGNDDSESHPPTPRSL